MRKGTGLDDDVMFSILPAVRVRACARAGALLRPPRSPRAPGGIYEWGSGEEQVWPHVKTHDDDCANYTPLTKVQWHVRMSPRA